MIFSFYTYDDYNSKITKICYFFFSFGIYYTTNAPFFVESTIHKIYENRGLYNINYQMPKILYSFIISYIINNIVSTLSLTEKKYFRNEKREKRFKYKSF